MAEDWVFLRRDPASGAVKAYRLLPGGRMLLTSEYAAGAAWWHDDAGPVRTRIQVDGYVAATAYEPGRPMWEPPATIEALHPQIEAPPDQGKRWE